METESTVLISVRYRYSCEMSLCMPYGSIPLFDFVSLIGLPVCFVYLLGNFQCISCLVVQSFDK